MTPFAFRLVVVDRLSRASEQLLGVSFLLFGATIVYLVLFDQGAAAAALFGTAAGHQNLLHELFHDGRHLASTPCH